MTAHEIQIKFVIEKNEKQVLQQLIKRLEKLMAEEEKKSRENLKLVSVSEKEIQ